MTYTHIKDSLKDKTVGIAGCGGLGSNCAVALARVGVGRLILCDFDKVEEGNLNRQYYFHNQIGQKKVVALNNNIQLVNPDIAIEIHDGKLGPGDMLEVFSQGRPELPLVVGLGMAGWGDNNSLRSRKIDNLYICGDEHSEISADLPPLAPRVGIVANMQANTVLEILLGNKG